MNASIYFSTMSQTMLMGIMAMVAVVAVVLSVMPVAVTSLKSIEDPGAFELLVVNASATICNYPSQYRLWFLNRKRRFETFSYFLAIGFVGLQFKRRWEFSSNRRFLKVRRVLESWFCTFAMARRPDTRLCWCRTQRGIHLRIVHTPGDHHWRHHACANSLWANGGKWQYHDGRKCSGQARRRQKQVIAIEGYTDRYLCFNFPFLLTLHGRALCNWTCLFFFCFIRKICLFILLLEASNGLYFSHAGVQTHLPFIFFQIPLASWSPPKRWPAFSFFIWCGKNGLLMKDRLENSGWGKGNNFTFGWPPFIATRLHRATGWSARQWSWE